MTLPFKGGQRQPVQDAIRIALGASTLSRRAVPPLNVRETNFL